MRLLGTRNKLPEYLEQVTIGDLQPNETVYTVPWAMQVDTDGTLYIRGDYTFVRRRDPDKTTGMRITMRHGYIEVEERSIRHERFSRSPITNETKIAWNLIPVELV